jgi:serine/threonine-protein kinase
MAELEFILESPERGRVVAFPSRSFVIGSGDDCQLCFKTALIAARHAEVVKDNRGVWWIRDLMGTGAVVVNNSPVLDERLNPGDKLRIADVLMTVRDSGVNQHARTRTGETPMHAVEKVEVELQPDTVIDNRYQIIKKIAAGGMGEVYRAVHVELGKPLALKVMLPELSSDPDFVGRFKREAIASSRIGQQNIIDISDFGRTSDGRFYFVMEYVDGKTLIKYRREGAFPFQRVVHVGLQMARALAAAHAAGIVHRDLKPENIMLVQRPGQPDFVKVLDFGIAKVASPNGTGAFTAIGTVVGTPQYMAPEQASALIVDARSDIYAMGLILHELVRGKPTFTGDSAVELMSQQVATPPPPLTSPHGVVPKALERIIMQMLQKVPDQRPQSMEAVVTALEAVASYPTPTARTEPIPAVKPGTATRVDQAPSETRVQSPTRAEEPLSITAAAGLVAVTSTEPALTPRPQSSKGETGVDFSAVRPNRTPAIIGALLVLILLLGGGVFYATQGDAQPPPVAEKPAPTPVPEVTPPPAEVKPPPKAEPQPVRLTLESVPEKVEVFEQDILLGATPLTISRPPGTLTELTLQAKGFTSLTRKVRFESDSSLRLELEKAEAPKPKKGPGAGGTKPRPPAGDDLMDLPD